MLETIQKVAALALFNCSIDWFALFVCLFVCYCLVASLCCCANSLPLDELQVLGQNFEFQPRSRSLRQNLPVILPSFQL